MTSRLRSLLTDSAKEETERLLSTPYTWFIKSTAWSVDSAITGNAQYSLNSAIASDVGNVVYDENGDLIVGQAWSNNYTTNLLKIRRPRHGITGGEVEWALSSITPPVPNFVYYDVVFYSKFLKKILAPSASSNTFVIIDSEGNIEKTVTTSFSWKGVLSFFNDRQVLISDYANKALEIANIADGSLAWSMSNISPVGPALVGFEGQYGMSHIYTINGSQVLRINWSSSDQYTLPSSPSLYSMGYFPYPRYLASYHGGEYLVLDSNDGAPAFGYIHWPFDTPNFCVPFAQSNNIDVHPYLNRVILTHKNSIFEIDINKAVESPPFTEGYAFLYSGQPSTTASTLAWTYTKRLRSVYLHINNGMNVNAAVYVYFIGSYNIPGDAVSTLTPPPTPAQSLTVSAGTSADVSITNPPMAILIQGASASTPSSGNLIISAEGEV